MRRYHLSIGLRKARLPFAARQVGYTGLKACMCLKEPLGSQPPYPEESRSRAFPSPTLC